MMKLLLIGIILTGYVDLDLPKEFNHFYYLQVEKSEKCVIMHTVEGTCDLVIDYRQSRIYYIVSYKKKVLFIYEKYTKGGYLVELYPTRKFIL